MLFSSSALSLFAAIVAAAPAAQPETNVARGICLPPVYTGTPPNITVS